MTGNDFMAWVLRSPFHGLLSNGMMLITVTGRRTGNKYTTPVGYYREDGSLWVISSRDRTWWRNVRGGADVKLLLNGKTISAYAETVMDETAVKKRIADYVRHIPMSARGLGVRVENGMPNAEDVAHLAAERLFVRITTN